MLQTKFAVIHYANEQEMMDFSWRISGQRFSFVESQAFATGRVDEIVSKVEGLLEIYPQNFRVDIFVASEDKEGPSAFYDANKKSITAFLHRMTDGVLAHEIAHALISSHFSSPLPEKMQEILAQYVDRHLWGDV